MKFHFKIRREREAREHAFVRQAKPAKRTLDLEME
jgi:hypothetical protein